MTAGKIFLCNVKIYEYQSQEVSSCLQNRLGTKKSWNLPNRINMNHCIIVLSLYLRFMYAVIAWNTCWLQKEISHDLIQFSMSFKVLLHINSSHAWWRKEACGKGIGDDLLAHLLLSRSKRKLRIFAESDEWLGEIHAVELSSWIKISQGPQPTSLTGNPSRSRSVFYANCASFIQPPNCA